MRLARLALRSAVRSLVRGGRRTVLAVFCVAVGVMAIVALRLAGDMVRTSLTSNVRDLIGGDVSVQSTAVPLGAGAVGVLDGLVRSGDIAAYAALGTERGALRGSGQQAQAELLVVDDPRHYPLVGSATTDTPPGGSDAALLSQPGAVLLSAALADELAAHPGDRLTLTLARGGAGEVVVGGVLPRRVVGGNPFFAELSRTSYTAVAAPGAPRYGLIQVVQPDPARAASVARLLRSRFPGASVQTVADALDQNLQASTNIDQFLEIVGLLALLIGGMGVVNTMQVSLRRRRIEMAMLKTVGWGRRQLYAVFATEAVLLGLCGGTAGAAAGIGVSAVVRVLIERAFLIDLTFAVNAGDVLDGLLVGVATALIFGLLPIVRAASVRPATVLRDTPTPVTAGSAVQSAGLYALLVAAFTGLAASLTGSLGVAIAVVVGTLVLVSVLGGLFWLLVWAVGQIPVPERITVGWLVGAVAVAVLTVLVARPLGSVGVALALTVGLGLSVIAMPRRWRTSVLLALRSMRRARGRTATTLVALFVGIFGVGLILVLGQDIRDRINAAVDQLSGYSVYAVAGPADAPALTRAVAGLPGLQGSRATADVTTDAVSFDGRSLGDIVRSLPATDPESGQRRTGAQFRFGSTAGVEGYSLRRGELPDLVVTAGRPLTSADAGTTNVLVRNDLARTPVGVHPGSTIVLHQATSGRSLSLHVVGLYTPARVTSSGVRLQFTFQPVLADVSAVDALAGGPSGPDRQTVVALQLNADAHADAVKALQRAVPRVYVLDIADFAEIVSRLLGNLVVLLVALASLSVIAGVVIIANTVALAMLERRREVGVLKAVGHSAASVLLQVLVENAIVAALGALAGMIAVSVTTTILADNFFGSGLPVSVGVVVLCVGGLVVVATGVAALVAWGPTRVRPVEVLRYE